MSRNKRVFKLGLIFFSLLVFLISASGALGIVWLRQQISRTANDCILKEKELMALHRKNGYLQSMIAQMHNPQYLREKVGSKMALPNKQQVVWMKDSKDLTRQNHLVVSVRNKSPGVVGGS